MNRGVVKTGPVLAAALAGALVAGCGVVGDEADQQAAAIRANCVDCHNAAEQVAGL